MRVVRGLLVVDVAFLSYQQMDSSFPVFVDLFLYDLSSLRIDLPQPVPLSFPVPKTQLAGFILRTVSSPFPNALPFF